MEDIRQNFHHHGRFYIFGDIDETIPEMITAPLVEEIINRSKTLEKESIQIFITSNGGRLDYAFDLVAAFDMAKTMGIVIETIVPSTACSAGSLIAICGHHRIVSERTYHLLHFAKNWDYSHNPEMSKRNHENLAFLNKQMIKLYEERTKVKDVKEKMLADNFMINGGKELIKQGLADQLI
jgi:ATP-dependent protease ClpP protease subunit